MASKDMPYLSSISVLLIVNISIKRPVLSIGKAPISVIYLILLSNSIKEILFKISALIFSSMIIGLSDFFSFLKYLEMS